MLIRGAGAVLRVVRNQSKFTYVVFLLYLEQLVSLHFHFHESLKLQLN